MIRIHHFTIAGALTAALLVAAGPSIGADKPVAPSEAKSTEKVDSAKKEDPVKQADAKPKRELGPELAALRDRVRQTLATYQKVPFNTQQNSPSEIMSVCLAFGCNSDVLLQGADGQHINGITCLCWNYPCNGFGMMGVAENHLAGRIGYGYQEHPGEFLATLALAHVQPDYPVRLGKTVRSVADLVAAEKLGCRSGSDASLKLIGLSYYVDEPQWKNDLGEKWSIARMIEDEIAEPIVTAPEGGMNRLMGLSCALARHVKHGRPLEGQFERAAKYTADYQAFALQLQNSDGSWGPYFLAARSTSPDEASQLRSTGRVLEWLATSLPDKHLEDPRVLGAVDYVTRLLGSQRYQWNAPLVSTREIVSLGHALHALAIYDERVFKPDDADEKPAAEKSQPATASRNVESPTSR